jgi:hypothetical protein
MGLLENGAGLKVVLDGGDLCSSCQHQSDIILDLGLVCRLEIQLIKNK